MSTELQHQLLRAIEDLGIALEATLFMDGPARESRQAIRRFHRNVGTLRLMLLNKGKAVIFDMLTITLGPGSY